MRTFVVCILALPLAAGGASQDSGRESVQESKASGQRKAKFTISKSTTYLTEPRDELGYIDYAAGLNALRGQGVTPENNAVALLWKAFGPGSGKAKMPVEFLQAVGIVALPEKGEYFVDLYTYMWRVFNRNSPEDSRTILAQMDAA